MAIDQAARILFGSARVDDCTKALGHCDGPDIDRIDAAYETVEAERPSCPVPQHCRRLRRVALPFISVVHVPAKLPLRVQRAMADADLPSPVVRTLWRLVAETGAHTPQARRAANGDRRAASASCAAQVSCSRVGARRGGWPE
jgi:hypothetical protein